MWSYVALRLRAHPLRTCPMKPLNTGPCRTARHARRWPGSGQSVPLPQIALTARPPGAAAAALTSKLRRASAFVPESPRLGLLLSASASAAGGSGGAHSSSSDGGNLGLELHPDVTAAIRRLGSDLSAFSVAANPAAEAAAARSKAAADAVAAAADAAAALAAVRALESRYGSAVAPDDQLLALEQEAAFRDRSRRLHEVGMDRRSTYTAYR